MRLVLLVITSLVPLLAFSLGVQYLAYRDARTIREEQAQALARSMANVIESELRADILTLQALALSPALEAGDIDGFRMQAAAVVAQQMPGAGILVLRADGQVLMDTQVAPGSPLPVRRNLEATRRMFATGLPVVSSLFQEAPRELPAGADPQASAPSPTSSRAVVAIDVPVRRGDGGIAYALSLTPPLDSFADIIRRQQLPPGWVVSVFDRQGVIVTRVPDPERFSGTPGRTGILDQLARTDEGVFETATRDGRPAIVVFSHTGPGGWAVAIGLPMAEVTAPAFDTAMRTLAVGGALLLGSLGLALLMARQIVGPISSLRRLATASEHDPSAMPGRTGMREVDEAVHALYAAEARRHQSEAEERKARLALREAELQLYQTQKMDAIGTLTGGMAHDFNNLLGVIIGNLDLARPLVEANADADEMIGEALDAALSGGDLTQRLLAFARRQPLQPEPVALNDKVTGIVKLLSRMLGTEIEITLDLAPDIWPVTVDPAQLEASLTNLATNARDAMRKGGHLTITTANRHLDADYAAAHADILPGDYAMIDVSDTGAGMSPAVLAQIFEPFFTTKERGRGTGLGLSMVFGFIKQSGGHINVYSEPGNGTTFRLYLPRANPAEESAPRRPVTAEPIGKAETILVVEDNAALRRVAVRQLSELGYGVIEAPDAYGALAILETRRVDLLFTDVVMPGGIDGFELARLVSVRWPDTRLLLTSGFSQANIGGPGQAMAASGRLLSKPYQRRELARLVREILDGR